MKNEKVILLNILDNELKNFLVEFRRKYNVKQQKLIPHITLRGPYKYKYNTISKNLINDLNNFVKNVKENKEDLLVSGAGIFDNNATYIVYLTVKENNNLKILTKKKDYPVSRFGFNPHVTVLSTKDKSLAYNIKEKLQREIKNYRCKNLEWTIHDLNRKDNLFNLADV